MKNKEQDQTSVTDSKGATEKLSLLVSILAFTVSCATMYVEFFDKNDAAKLHVANLRMKPFEPLFFDMVFINDGDYPLSIIECTVIASKEPSFQPRLVIGKQSPFVIKPGEIRMETSQCVFPENDAQSSLFAGEGKRYIGIRIEMLDHDGRKRVSRYTLIEDEMAIDRHVLHFSQRTFDLMLPTEKDGAVKFKEAATTHDVKR